MLIKCHECGAAISSYAKSCPHCGCPRASRFSRVVIVGFLKHGISTVKNLGLKCVKCVLPLFIIGLLTYFVYVLDEKYQDPVLWVKASSDLKLNRKNISDAIISENRFELFKFLSNKHDANTIYTYFDDYFKRNYGISMFRGNLLNKDRKPFKNAEEYDVAMFLAWLRTYKDIASPEWQVWNVIKDGKEWWRPQNDSLRKRLIKFTRKYVTRVNHYFLSQGEVKCDQDKLLEEYDSRMNGENFVGVYQFFDSEFHFKDPERSIIFSSLKNKGKMSSKCLEYIDRLFEINPNRAKTISNLEKMCHPCNARCWLEEAFALDLLEDRSYGQNVRDAEGLVFLALLLTFVVAGPLCCSIHYGWKRKISRLVEWILLWLIIGIDTLLFLRAAFKTPYVTFLIIGIVSCIVLVVLMLVIMKHNLRTLDVFRDLGFMQCWFKVYRRLKSYLCGLRTTNYDELRNGEHETERARRR